MYRIAICDDDMTFIAYMERIISIANSGRDYQYAVYRFGSGEDLIESLAFQSAYFDLLILDIALGGIDGDETAKLFRQKCDDAVLVFCSGVRTPCVQSFKATPYRYLLKSSTEKQLVLEMKEILAQMKRNSSHKYIIGHYRNNIIRVSTKNILYIENAKRGSRIIVRKDCKEADFENPILVSDKLETLSSQFPELVFAHSSYLVNINHVEKIIGSLAYLDTGECMSISRAYNKLFREIFTKNIASKY